MTSNEKFDRILHRIIELRKWGFFSSSKGIDT